MNVQIRRVRPDDAASVWKLVNSCPELDSNSFYCYFVLCRYFTGSCLIAEQEGGQAVGFVTALLPPDRPDTCFVWQMCVVPDQRGQRLGLRMLEQLLEGLPVRPRFVEATVAPGNERSRRTLIALARRYGAPIEEKVCLTSADFPDYVGGGHEPEHLLRIGPL